MRRPVRRTLCIAALAIAVPASAVLAGCSDDGAAGAASTAAAPVAAAFTDGVVQGHDLAGFRAPAAQVLDLAGIASENDVSVAELRARGVVRQAVAKLSGPPQAFGISAVEELASPARARTEAARLLAVNGSPEPGLTATPIAVPGIAGAKGARKAGRHDGQDFVAIEVTWAEGVMAHELFVLGRAGDISQADVLAAARAVSARGAGG